MALPASSTSAAARNERSRPGPRRSRPDDVAKRVELRMVFISSTPPPPATAGAPLGRTGGPQYSARLSMRCEAEPAAVRRVAVGKDAPRRADCPPTRRSSKTPRASGFSTARVGRGGGLGGLEESGFSATCLLKQGAFDGRSEQVVRQADIDGADLRVASSSLMPGASRAWFVRHRRARGPGRRRRRRRCGGRAVAAWRGRYYPRQPQPTTPSPIGADVMA